MAVFESPLILEVLFRPQPVPGAVVAVISFCFRLGMDVYTDVFDIRSCLPSLYGFLLSDQTESWALVWFTLV